ncbi:hypothetical protein BDR03DRAFT_1003909 [Suillus americanus]|nr:hypothetical protein BDR03DRAFT_1003909 [Suillus americanus]
MNPCGQDVASQLGLPGDHATTPVQYQSLGLLESDQPRHQLGQPPPQLYLLPQLYPPPLDQPRHQLDQLQLGQPPPQLYLPPLDQPRRQLHQPPPQLYPPPHHLHHPQPFEGVPPPSQPNMGSGHMSQWGAAHMVALAPRHLGENIGGERTQGVIQRKSHISDVGRRRRQARLPSTPELPSAHIDDVPASTVMPTNNELITPVMTLTPSMARKYRELAKENLCCLIINVAIDTDRAPSTSTCNTMINTVLQTAKTELVDQSMVNEPKGIHDYMVSSLANMRCGFKAHAMSVIHMGYDLQQPLFSLIDDASHKKLIIPKLLKDLDFLHLVKKVCINLRYIQYLTLRLKTPDGQEIERLLEHPVLINMIINVLIAGLSKVLDGWMDRLFGLCGTMLYCVLSAYITGKFNDVLVNLQTFDNVYKKIMDYINTTIRMSDELMERFDAVQEQIIRRVQHDL